MFFPTYHGPDSGPNADFGPDMVLKLIPIVAVQMLILSLILILVIPILLLCDEQPQFL